MIRSEFCALLPDDDICLVRPGTRATAILVRMAECQGLGKSLKSQTKYGTTSKLMCVNESFIKHYVRQTETLQGIALKYGCTVSKYGHLSDIFTDQDIFHNSESKQQEFCVKSVL